MSDVCHDPGPLAKPCRLNGKDVVVKSADAANAPDVVTSLQTEAAAYRGEHGVDDAKHYMLRAFSLKCLQPAPAQRMGPECFRKG